MNTKIYIYIKYSVQIFGSKLRIFSNRFEVTMEKGKIPLHLLSRKILPVPVIFISPFSKYEM